LGRISSCPVTKSSRHPPPQLTIDLPVQLADYFIVTTTAIPSGAYIRVGECRFERDTCDWYNDTTQEKSSASWRLATVSRRPANLPDKTFGAPGKNSDKIDAMLKEVFSKKLSKGFLLILMCNFLLF
jgi:hypothetical protein